MANTAIQNIKILHKRYSTDQWTNGLTINGVLTIPKLAQGEIGLNTTTQEVRIGTDSFSEQSWSQAKVIGGKVATNNTYHHADKTTSTTAKEGADYVLTSSTLTENDGTYTLTNIYKDITLITPEIPDLKVTDGSVVAGEGEVAVITSIAKGGDHEITSTKATATTKAYVDGRKLTATKDGNGQFLTGIKSVSNIDGNHEVIFESGDLEIDFPELTVTGNDSTGDYIKSISVDPTNDHNIVVTKATLPVGTGNKTAGDLEFIDSVSLNGHTLTATSKGIVGDGNVISVEKNADGKIQITADTYTKAEIDEAHNNLAKAMKFAGTLGTGEGALSALPSKANQGDVYKVVTAGTYGTQAAKVGDLFIYDGNKWRYVPSGDESFTDTWRAISVNGTQIKDNSIGGGDINFAGGNAMSVTHADGTITISHNDTSSAENLTKKARQYVDGLTFDEYGHVTGYTVGEEVDQDIPGASGSIVTSNLEVMSGATLTTDDNGNHILTGSKKTFAEGAKIDVSEANNTITVSHETISTTEGSGTDTTITAGGVNKSFKVVDSISNDGYGHITEVKTKTVTVEVPEDTNTTYEIDTTSNSSIAGETSANINLKGSDNSTDSVTLKVDSKTTTPADGLQVSVSGDTITLSGKATKDLLGLIRAAYNLDSAASATVTDGYIKKYSGSNNDKLYGVNVKNDGTAFVEVPWVDTHKVAANFDAQTTPSTVDLYAFNTDEYGHVESVYAVTTIDGNYA